MSNINDTTRKKLLEELEYDPKQDSSSETSRIKLLKRDIIDEYGLNGLDLIQGNYFDCSILPDKKYKHLLLLSDAEKSCPWKKYAHEDPGVIVDQIFKNVHHHLPKFLPDFRSKCKYVFAIMWSRKTWALGYLIEQPAPIYYKIFVGNPPNENPEITSKDLIDLQWKLPQPLKDFYAIHNGFSDVTSFANTLSPVEWLTSMRYLTDNSFRAHFAKIILDKIATAAFEKEVAESPLTFNPENMLQFFRYTISREKERSTYMANQCFDRTNNENPLTVLCKDSMFRIANKESIYKDLQWKIEDRGQSFYDFIDERLWGAINGESFAKE